MTVVTRLGRHTLARSLMIVLGLGVVLYLITGSLTDYRNTQLISGAYYFAALAGLTVLAGQSGRISLGHGALMAFGAYTTVLLIGKAGWPLAPALAAAALATALVGVPMGVASTRLQGPYLAGATLAFAVGLPALADKFPGLLGGENGLIINPPTPPSWDSGLSLYHWGAWVACLCALIVLFVLYNLVHSGAGRALRATRDDEIAASLCGLHVARTQTVAFVVSAAAAGLGGGVLAAVSLNSVAPGAFPLSLSLDLLAGVVIGGLGSLVGAVWGAALLVLLPNWTTDLANSFSASTNVRSNLPLAVYGVVLIALILVWPSGIQGGVRAISKWARARARLRQGRTPSRAA